ncbi:MAG: hypothetical protein JWM87_109 [Candidatus Eremiobacteraeota bacterium]|nr:hypothetical protein [Candidatus Eremiobacteraeota bacterium]
MDNSATLSVNESPRTDPSTGRWGVCVEYRCSSEHVPNFAIDMIAAGMSGGSLSERII